MIMSQIGPVIPQRRAAIFLLPLLSILHIYLTIGYASLDNAKSITTLLTPVWH